MKPDLRQEPAYSLSEAANYLRMSPSTLRSWIVGQPYHTQAGRKFFAPVIRPAQRDPLLLSFVNLVEAYTLAAIRRRYNVQLKQVRKAVAYLKKQFGSDHPLAEKGFRTDGINLFIEKSGLYISASQGGQTELRVVKKYLSRIEQGRDGLPKKLYPLTRKREFDDSPTDEPTIVVIDPRIAFGRPVIAGTGIPVSVLAERYIAGETIDELAEDYGREREEIEEAVRSVCAA